MLGVTKVMLTCAPVDMVACLCLALEALEALDQQQVAQLEHIRGGRCQHRRLAPGELAHRPAAATHTQQMTRPSVGRQESKCACVSRTGTQGAWPTAVAVAQAGARQLQEVRCAALSRRSTCFGTSSQPRRTKSAQRRLYALTQACRKQPDMEPPTQRAGWNQ